MGILWNSLLGGAALGGIMGASNNRRGSTGDVAGGFASGAFFGGLVGGVAGIGGKAIHRGSQKWGAKLDSNGIKAGGRATDIITNPARLLPGRVRGPVRSRPTPSNRMNFPYGRDLRSFDLSHLW